MNSFGQIKEEINLEKFNSVYYFEFGKYFQHPPESHDFWEMVYVDKGRAIAYTGGIASELHEGQAVFHKPGENHAHISDESLPNNMFVVSFVCKSECMSFFEGKTFTLDENSKTLLSMFIQEAKNALGDIKGDYYDNSPLDFSGEKFGSSQLMKYHFTEFLIKLIRSGQKDTNDRQNSIQARSTKEDALINSIISYFKNNIYNKITLADVCRNFYIKESRLSVIFKEETGKSPMQYYAELKIREAKKLLRENTLSVGEISDKLGYSDIYSFSRSFKALTGFSPTGYKKSIIFLDKQ